MESGRTGEDRATTYRWEALEALQQELISAAQTGIEVTLLVMFTPDIRHNLQPDEAICVSPQFWANPLLFYQPSIEPYVVGGSSIDVNDLECAAQQAPGPWNLRHAAPIGDPTGALTG